MKHFYYRFTLSKLFLVTFLTFLANPGFTQNLLTNGGFENGKTGWEAWSATFTISSDAKEGNSAALITNRKNPWDALARNITSLLENGQSYTISAWVKIPDPATAFRITLGMKVDGANTYTSLCRTDAPVIGSYQFYTQTFQVNWNGNLEVANIYIETESVEGVYSDYLADEIVLEKFIPEPPVVIEGDGLKDFSGSMLMGGVIGGDKNYFTDTTAKAQVLKDCNTIQITCYPAWGRWDEQKRHVYHVEDFSSKIKEMKSQNLSTTAHMLMGWDKYFPERFRKGDFPADTLDAIMKSWFDAIILNEGNDTLVDNWNIVNEAISWDGKGGYWPIFNENYESACEFQRMGFEPDASGLTGEEFVNAEHPVYIRKAFEYARTLTNKKLELRDSGFEFPGSHKYHAFYQLAKHLKEVGAPVDVIGFQTHLNIEQTYDWEGYTNNIKRFIDLGYEVIIPEVDIGDTEKDWTEEKAQKQKEQYYNLVTAAIKGGATEFHTWGFIDNNETGWRYGESAFQYANNFEQKPAWFGIKEALIDMGSVLFWEMAEPVIDTMPDVMRFNNFGVMKHFETPVIVAGYKNKALQFDGVDDYISSRILSETIVGDFTFSCFVKTETNQAGIIAELSQDDQSGLKIGIDAEGKLVLYLSGIGSNENLVSSNAVNDGIWHFVTVQKDSVGFKLYVDDTSPQGITEGVEQEFKKLTVGAKKDGSETFEGTIDEVKLYNSAIEEASFERNYFVQNQPMLEYKYSRMRVRLDWTAMGDEEVGYVVDRKTGDGEWEAVGEVDKSTLFYIETLDLYDTDYYYRVRSSSKFANSGSSNEVTFLTPNDSNTGIEMITDEGIIDVFPNPVKDKFQLNLQETVDIKVFDIQGKLMLEKGQISGSEIIDISCFESGVYFVRAVGKGKTSVLKLIKE